MGKGVLIKCKSCGHCEDFLTGVGLMAIKEGNKIRKKLVNGGFGVQFKEILNNYPEAHINWEHAVYHCGDCGSYKGKYYIRVHAEGIEKTKVYLCNRCKKKMQKASLIDVLNIDTCPKCGSSELLKECMYWD